MHNSRFADCRIRVSEKKIAFYKWKGFGIPELKAAFASYKFHSVVTACVTGTISGIFAIDIDDMDEYEQFKQKYNLECFTKYTYCESTRRGFHAYFGLPDELQDLQCSASTIHPKIDIRANGGYIIIAPSRTFDSQGLEVGEVRAMNDQPVSFPRQNLRQLLANTITADPGCSLFITCRLLDLINPARYTDRDAWLQFGTCLKACGYSAQTFCHYSAKNEKHNPCTCEIVYSSLKMLKIGKPTLMSWAKMDDPVGYEDYKKMQRLEAAKAKRKQTSDMESEFELEAISIGRFDHTDTYCYIDFIREFGGTKYESYEDLDSTISAYVAKVVSYISTFGGFVTKTSKGHALLRKLGEMEPTFTYPGSDGNIVKLTLSKYIKRKSGLMFERIDCDISNSTPNHVFNVFQGYKGKLIDNVDTEAVEMMNKFIMDVWADGDPDIADYVISWLANMVQTPDMARTALVVASTQGCGKNTLSDFMRLILGDGMVSEVIGIGSLVQKHNTCSENKRLIVINEMSSTSSEFRSAFDKLKPYISDTTLTIEPKGFPPYAMTNISNLMMFTNHADSLIAEKSDRRYQIMKLSECRRGNDEYFRNLRKTCFNDLGRDSYYTFLMNYKIRNLSKLILTPLKAELIEFSKSSSERFYDYYVEGHPQGFIIKASQFHSMYAEWCRECCERNTVSLQKFASIMGNLVTKRRKEDGVYYIKQCDTKIMQID